MDSSRKVNPIQEVEELTFPQHRYEPHLGSGHVAEQFDGIAGCFDVHRRASGQLVRRALH